MSVQVCCLSFWEGRFLVSLGRLEVMFVVMQAYAVCLLEAGFRFCDLFGRF